METKFKNINPLKIKQYDISITLNSHCLKSKTTIMILAFVSETMGRYCFPVQVDNLSTALRLLPSQVEPSKLADLQFG